MEPYLIPDVVTQQEESDELIDDYDEVQAEQEPNPTSHAKVRKARTKATVERVPGHTILQLSRVESVVRGDGGDSSLTKEATFALAIATEEFIKRISRLAWDRAQADYRSTLQYRDMARTARQVPQLNFLQDIIPLPIPLHQAMALRTARENGAEPEIMPAPASTPSAPLPKPKSKAARTSTASTAKSTSSKPPRQRDNRGRWSQGGALSAASPSGRGVKSDTDEQTELQAQAATNADVSSEVNRLSFDSHDKGHADDVDSVAT